MPRIKKVCCYRNNGEHYNVLPAILVTPQDDGVIVAFKWLTGHLGFYLTRSSVEVGNESDDDPTII